MTLTPLTSSPFDRRVRGRRAGRSGLRRASALAAPFARRLKLADGGEAQRRRDGWRAMSARNPQRPVAAPHRRPRRAGRGVFPVQISGGRAAASLPSGSDPADAPGDAAERQARAGQAAQVLDRTDADAARRAPQEIVLALLPGEPLRVAGNGILAGDAVSGRHAAAARARARGRAPARRARRRARARAGASARRRSRTEIRGRSPRPARRSAGRRGRGCGVPRDRRAVPARRRSAGRRRPRAPRARAEPRPPRQRAPPVPPAPAPPP